MEISKKKKLKQDQIKMDLENAKLMQELLDNEAKKEVRLVLDILL